jgi:hypothetical protein
MRNFNAARRTVSRGPGSCNNVIKAVPRYILSKTKEVFLVVVVSPTPPHPFFFQISKPQQMTQQEETTEVGCSSYSKR